MDHDREWMEENQPLVIASIAAIALIAISIGTGAAVLWLALR